MERDIPINFNVTGLDDVREAIKNTHRMLDELYSAVDAVSSAVVKLGVNASQPMADTTD